MGVGGRVSTGRGEDMVSSERPGWGPFVLGIRASAVAITEAGTGTSLALEEADGTGKGATIATISCSHARPRTRAYPQLSRAAPGRFSGLDEEARALGRDGCGENCVQKAHSVERKKREAKKSLWGQSRTQDWPEMCGDQWLLFGGAARKPSPVAGETSQYAAGDVHERHVERSFDGATRQPAPYPTR